jgi:hypothetical protein
MPSVISFELSSKQTNFDSWENWSTIVVPCCWNSFECFISWGENITLLVFSSFITSQCSFYQLSYIEELTVASLSRFNCEIWCGIRYKNINWVMSLELIKCNSPPILAIRFIGSCRNVIWAIIYNCCPFKQAALSNGWKSSELQRRSQLIDLFFVNQELFHHKVQVIIGKLKLQSVGNNSFLNCINCLNCLIYYLLRKTTFKIRDWTLQITRVPESLNHSWRKITQAVGKWIFAVTNWHRITKFIKVILNI